jgi:hypothetical protein
MPIPLILKNNPFKFILSSKSTLALETLSVQVLIKETFTASFDCFAISRIFFNVGF